MKPRDSHYDRETRGGQVNGQRKEAEATHTTPKTMQTRGDIRQGFVYERVPHVTAPPVAPGG